MPLIFSSSNLRILRCAYTHANAQAPAILRETLNSGILGTHDSSWRTSSRSTTFVSQTGGMPAVKAFSQLYRSRFLRHSKDFVEGLFSIYKICKHLHLFKLFFLKNDPKIANGDLDNIVARFTSFKRNLVFRRR